MSFRRRLQWSFVGVAVVVPTAAVMGLVVTARRAEERDLDDALILEAREELSVLLSHDQRLQPQLSGELIASEYGTELVRHALLFDPAGHVLAMSPAMGKCAEQLHLDSPLPRRGFDVPCGDVTLRAVVRDAKTTRLGPLVIAVPRTSLDADTRFMIRLAAAFMVVSSLVATLISVWLTRRLASGLERIAATTRRVAGGDLAARAPVSDGDDEVRELGHNINHMVEQIQTLVGAQERFIAHAAHELRSPLTTLYGELALALRKERSNEDYKRSLTEAHASALHLKQLAEGLLELARAGQQAHPDHDTRTVTEAVASAIAARQGLLFARGAAVFAQGDATKVLALPTHVERIVGNLLENAIKHAPATSTVRVTWSGVDDALVLHVDDSGPGVAPAERPRLFEPFYRGPEERAYDGSGFGLGLAIVRELARKNRGTVEVSDSPQGGARFTLRLPVAAEPE